MRGKESGTPFLSGWTFLPPPADLARVPLPAAPNPAHLAPREAQNKRRMGYFLSYVTRDGASLRARSTSIGRRAAPSCVNTIRPDHRRPTAGSKRPLEFLQVV